mgnify:CR=1 FL=1
MSIATDTTVAPVETRTRCGVCLQVCRITDAGNVQTHGPRGNRCPGSGKYTLAHLHRLHSTANRTRNQRGPGLRY